jgi:hypothetical protein
MDRGAKVLVVREDGGAIQQIPWNGPADLSYAEEATIAVRPDLGAEIQMRAEGRNDFAVILRRTFEIAAQRKEKLERIFGQRFAGASLKSESFSNLLNIDEPVTFGAALDVPRFVTESPEGLTVRAPEDFFQTGDSLQGIASLEKRTWDVLLGNPRRSLLKTVYVLPKELKVKSLPPEHDLESRFGRLKVSCRAEGADKVVMERLLEITSPRVSVADYPEFREFAASVNRLEDEKMVLERLGGEATRE